MKKYFLMLIAGAIFFSFLRNASAEDVRYEIDRLKVRLSELERKLDEQKEASKSLLEGISIGGGATFIIQGTIDANATASKGEDVTDGSYSVDLELEKSFDNGGTLFVHFEVGEGAGVMDSDELDLFSGVNKDATGGSGNLSLVEAWYEQNSLDESFVFTFGKLDPTCYFDTNAVAGDETSQFLGDMFKNSAVLEFPDDNTAGIRAGFSPSEWIELGAGVWDANADWEDLGDALFAIGEINFKPEFFYGREGNYRFYTWVNDKDHTKLLDATKSEERGYGFGLSFDQQFTDNLTAFTRFGWQDEEVYNCDMSWSTGLQLAGERWGRDEDVLGIAIGQVIPGDDYEKAGNPAHKEGHLEAYYNIHINDSLSITPDVQVIQNPKGVKSDSEGRDDMVVVLGVRTQISF